MRKRERGWDREKGRQRKGSGTGKEGSGLRNQTDKQAERKRGKELQWQARPG